MVSLSPDQFRTIGNPSGASVLIQGSKFIAWIAGAVDMEMAEAVLHQRQSRYPDATHHCWAFRIGRPGELVERFSDAGEPNGTAGRPMSDALRHAQLENVACIVSRYFGGTKLGTGGLARAYSFAVETAIASAEITERTIRRRVQVDFDHERTGPLFRTLEEFGLHLVPTVYDSRGHGTVMVPASRFEMLNARVHELARTGVDLTPGELVID